MPKMKTRKALVKKVKVSKGGKVLRSSTGINHFNARETGSARRGKRGMQPFFAGDEKNFKRALIAHGKRP